MDIRLIGERIRATRKYRNIKAEDLAEQLGIATESLLHIENGARRTSLQTLLNIADILDVSLDYLMGRSQSSTAKALQEALDEEELSDREKALLIDAAKHLIPFIRKLSS